MSKQRAALLTKDLLERIKRVVAEEEESHRELACVFDELMSAENSGVTPAQIGRYIQCMQSFDQMRQRVEYLANTTSLMVSHGDNELDQLLQAKGKSAPIMEDGTWLLEKLEQGTAGE